MVCLYVSAIISVIMSQAVTISLTDPGCCVQGHLERKQPCYLISKYIISVSVTMLMLSRCRRVTSRRRSLPGASFLRNVCIREAPHGRQLPAAKCVPALPQRGC